MSIPKSFSPTALDYAILGLVNKNPLSGYGIRKEFETTALGNFSSSPGSIYPALNRLQKQGLIIKWTTENKKQKFFVTSTGKEILIQWFLQPIEKKDITHRLNELLLRFGLMGTLLTKEQKIEFLHSLAEMVKKYIEELQRYYDSPLFDDLPLQGKLAFEHGLVSYRTTLNWCKKSTVTLKKLG
ncbi:MAG: PadR family transcriptional regulator [Flavobacteriaceae bacterium]